MSDISASLHQQLDALELLTKEGWVCLLCVSGSPLGSSEKRDITACLEQRALRATFVERLPGERPGPTEIWVTARHKPKIIPNG